jgi:hypothetical protein
MEGPGKVAFIGAARARADRMHYGLPKRSFTSSVSISLYQNRLRYPMATDET